MIEPTANNPPFQARWSPPKLSTALMLAIGTGVLACAVAAGYLVRTPAAIGDRVGRRLAGLARQRGVNLTVASFRPQGLYGLRLQDVHLGARRGDYLIEADLDAVDITPSLGAFLDGGHIAPGAVDVDGGRVQISRAPRPSGVSAAPKTPASPPLRRHLRRTSPRSTASGPPGKIGVVLHDLTVQFRMTASASIRPVVVHRADFDLQAGARPAIEFHHGYGELPDATPFAIRRRASNGPATYLVTPRRRTRLDQWVDVDIPARVSANHMTLCPGCSPATVTVEELRGAGPAGLSGTSARLSLRAGDDELRVDLADVALRRHHNILGVRLRNLEAVYDTQIGTAIVQGDIFDGQSGRASVAGRWSSQWAVLETTIQMDGLHVAQLWPAVGLGDYLWGGVYDGNIQADWQPQLDLVSCSLDLTSRDQRVDIPVVTHQALQFGRVAADIDATFQPRAHTLSISRGQAYLGDAGPIGFGGYAVDAERGWVFDAHAGAAKLDPQALRDGAPAAIAHVARGSQFSGEFGFDIHSAGHTGFAPSISLSVDFDGRVDVDAGSSYADVLALASGGPPSVELPGRLAQHISTDAWIAYDSLPHQIPRVLTAAEDARFFDHSGFDWGGLRRALAYNVEAGGIKRGGSTLSQQLAKNLFLDNDRTLVRKLQEAYVTWRLESELSKQRILELYLNLVDWGPHIQGLQQAARQYFGRDAAELSVGQTALLGALLPGPSLYGAKVLAGYLPSSRVEKIEHILSNLRFLGVISADQYRRIHRRSRRGQIGGLQLVVCDDDGRGPEDAPDCD